MARAGLRIGVVGATGSLGNELLETLAVSSLPVGEIVPFATDRSLGTDVEFQGSDYGVEVDSARLTALDLLFVCAPAAASLEFIHTALHERIPCIDLSGATSGSDDVPMRIAGYGSAPVDTPVVALPTSPSLPWVLVLQPLMAAAGLRRVRGSVLRGAAAAGKQGLESLYHESLALFNQQAAPEPTVFRDPVAFDCVPDFGPEAEEGSDQTNPLIRDLALLLGSDVLVAANTVQVPIFVGLGSTLFFETERELEPSEAKDVLRKAPGVEVWEGDSGASTRAAAGRDVVVVGDVRRDPTAERGLQLWLVADPLRLAASHAIQLAAQRLG